MSPFFEHIFPPFLSLYMTLSADLSAKVLEIRCKCYEIICGIDPQSHVYPLPSEHKKPAPVSRGGLTTCL